MQDTISSYKEISAARISFLAGSNPVLGRELRSALRNERAFALLALYVALLGTIIASQFPASQHIANSVQPGSGQGYDLFMLFCGVQAAGIVLLLPALASGALAQERERQTLEPILLTPMTTGQIVWGKAVGVLCFGFLLLLATLPLTSLSFLLGGVSPADIITAYAVLLGLAAFVTGFGLYCSARWPNAVQATVACYALLPFLLGFVVVLFPMGATLAGIALITSTWYWLWKKLLSYKTARPARMLGSAYDVLAGLVVVAFSLVTIYILLKVYGLGWSFFGIVFVTPYLLYVARLGIERTGEELGRKREPRRPVPERLNDLRDDWKRAMTNPNTAAATEPGEPTDKQWASLYQEMPAPGQPTTMVGRNTEKEVAQATRKREKKVRETYGVRAFLPDNLNPVLGKDMRAGLMGKWSYLGRYAYVVTILSELLLIGMLLFSISTNSDWLVGWMGQSTEQNVHDLAGWACMHLTLLMFCGALFGARALAPEREQQTLQQLLTTPLQHTTIIFGKIMAVGLYTIYALLMTLPLAVLFWLLGVVTFTDLLRFLTVEIVLAALAAAWGVYCSMRGVTVRRALGLSLGGVVIVLIASLFSMALPAYSYRWNKSNFDRTTRIAAAVTLPYQVMYGALVPPAEKTVYADFDMQTLSDSFMPLPIPKSDSPRPNPFASPATKIIPSPIEWVVYLSRNARLFLSVFLLVLMTIALILKTKSDFRRYTATV